MSTIDTPSPHSEAAAALVNQLRTLMNGISGFGFVTKVQRQRINATASVPDAFLLQLAQALDASPEFARSANLQGSELRDAVNFSNAYGPVATELAIFARGLLETIAARRADAGDRGLQAYTLAKSRNRRSQKALTVPHLPELKNTLGRGRRKKTAVPVVAQPEPVAGSQSINPTT